MKKQPAPLPKSIQDSPRGVSPEEWQEFKTILGSQAYSLNTQKTYLLNINDFLRTHTFTQADINSYLKNPKKNHSCVKSALKAFLRFKPVEGVGIPMQRGRVKKRILKSIDEDCLNTIFDGLTGDELLCCLIMFKTGLRISEVLGLTYADVDLRNFLLKGVGKGDVEFKAEIDKEIADAIQQKFLSNSKNTRSTKLFGFSRFRMNYVLNKFDSVLDGRHVTPHQFRHTFATILRQNGFALDEVQQIMRHKSIATTQVYAEVDRAKLGERMRELWGEPLPPKEEVVSEIEEIEEDGMMGG